MRRRPTAPATPALAPAPLATLRSAARRVPRAALCAVLLAATAAGCATLPRGAAVSGEVLRGAAAPGADIAIYPVTREVLPAIASWPDSGERPDFEWLPRRPGAATPALQVGDQIDLTVWDPDENSLLTPPNQRVASMPTMTVGEGGEIFVPYVGNVGVAGLSPQEARRTVQGRIEAVSPAAQVQLTLAGAGRRNSVDLVGGVTRPGPVPLPDRDFTVLSLIGQGGGARESLANPQVRLVRGGRDYTAPLERLYADPSLDTTLQGGDRVIVTEDERSFIALGAAGAEEIVPFGQESVTALEALSLIGGLDDDRANPRGVLVLRQYPREAVRPAGPGGLVLVEEPGPGGDVVPAVAVDPSGPDRSRVVFTLDLTSADGLFAAREFLIRPGDVVLATESRVTSAETVLGLVGRGFGVIRQGRGL